MNALYLQICFIFSLSDDLLWLRLSTGALSRLRTDYHIRSKSSTSLIIQTWFFGWNEIIFSIFNNSDSNF